MHNTDFEYLRKLYWTSDIVRINMEIRRLINALSTSPSSYCKMFFHPLGFIYTTLHSFSNDETFRLHIWNKNFYDISPKMDIHNHYYKVNSYVFCGCVINQLYKIHDIANVNVNQYKGSYADNGDRILTKIDDGLFVIEGNKSIHCSGELYVIERDQIHSGGSLDEKVTCTVVYTQEPGAKSPIVFGRGQLPDILHFNLEQVPAQTVEALLYDLNKFENK